MYRFWTFNCHVPGPFIRTRVGDTLEIQVMNHDTNGMLTRCVWLAHGAPGAAADEIARGLWPQAPNLAKTVPDWTPAQLF